MTSASKSRQSLYANYLEHPRKSIRKSIVSPTEQRNKMNKFLNTFVYELEQCNGDGYDHFLQTSEPIRNAQRLAQRNINHKVKN